MEGEELFTFDEWKAYKKVSQALGKEDQKEPEQPIEPASKEEVGELCANLHGMGKYVAKKTAELSEDQKMMNEAFRQMRI